MYPYATIEQVTAAFPPALSALGVGSYNVTTTQINSYYIFTAQGVVDSYLSARYVTPVSSPTPAIVTKLTVDLVVYELFRDRGMRIPDFMNDRYQSAMEMLKAISMGKMKIPGGTEVQTGDNEAFSTAMNYHPVFSPVLKDIDQRVDPDFYDREFDRRWPNADPSTP